MAASVELIAPGASNDLIVAPTTNPSLRLASALSGLNEELVPLVGTIAKEGKAQASAKAQADAMANSGVAFAEAVRTGRLEKTQNPWYIEAYEQTAAAVRARSEMADLIGRSQTFEQRNDPAAFATELTRQAGEIGQHFSSTSQAAGFNAAAQPLLAQALQQNVQYNVSRINEEHVQNVSTMATTNILSSVQANGGKPTAAQVFDAIEPQHKDWIGTGGTESDWNELVINSVVGAAFNAGNPDLLNVLDDTRGGKGALSNIAGPDGQPVGQSLAAARFRIEQAAENKGMGEIKAMQNAVKLEGLKAVQMVWESEGYDFLNGGTSKGEVLAMLQAKGVSPQAAAYAIGELEKSATDNLGLAKALQGQNPDTLSLYARGVRQGYSPAYEAEVAEKVRTGELTADEGQSFISAASSRTNHLESEARSDARAAKSDARAELARTKALTVSQAKDLKTNRARIASLVAGRFESAGVKLFQKPATRSAFERGLADAENRALLRHPGDTGAATAAVDAYAAQYMILNKPKPRTAPATSSASSAANPRR